MKSRLVFSLCAALIFLSVNISSYAQEKTVTSAKDTKQIQEKQLTKPTKTHQMKMIKDDAVKTNNKKVIQKAVNIKDKKTLKNEPSTKLNKKEVVHHKKLEKKTQKKESNTPQKK